MKEPIWTVRAPAPIGETSRIVSETGLPPLLASMLWSRGLREKVAAELEPELKPTRIPTLQLAALRLNKAISEQKRILIHGDYDADGISGTAVLTMGLRSIGARVDTFIPNRLTDGYGVSMQHVEQHAGNADVFVTVDCGISNLAEIAALQEAGVEVIVTDHHTPGQQLPDCLVVHPRYADDAAPDKPELTGAGVAWHLLWAVYRLRGLPAPLEYADLASIGTIADVAPLLGENRALVQEGLRRMSASNWPGLRASVAHSRLSSPISARHVAFILAPRLNAAGRLGEAELGLELLMTASETRARELAIYLDARNQQRRQIQDEMYERMLEQVNPAHPALVVHDRDGHPGVMGIVASKLLETYYKPVFIIAKGKGSVRSTPGISAVEALQAASRYLLGFGGHSQAAGFSLDPAAIPDFERLIHGFVRQHAEPQPRVVIDHVLASGDASSSLIRTIERLEPLGQGIEAPVFALTGQLESARAVGKDARTLQLRLGGLKGVWWGNGERAGDLDAGMEVHAAISLAESEYRGVTSIEFRVDDLRPAAQLDLHEDQAEVPELPASVHRGKPAGAGLHVTELPLGTGPAELTRPFSELLQQEVDIWLDLDEAALTMLRRARSSLPDLADSRRAWVMIKRGTPLPWSEERNSLARQILTELDLLDARGFARQGQKRDPWTSPTLRACELERYRLAAFESAYRHFSDAAFEVAISRLFGVEPVQPA